MIKAKDNQLGYIKSRNEEKIMNIVTLIGRLTRDADIRYAQGENAMAIARFTLAVDKNFKKKRR